MEPEHCVDCDNYTGLDVGDKCHLFAAEYGPLCPDCFKKFAHWAYYFVKANEERAKRNGND